VFHCSPDGFRRSNSRAPEFIDVNRRLHGSSIAITLESLDRVKRSRASTSDRFREGATEFLETGEIRDDFAQ
jgi:hypothetical protein